MASASQQPRQWHGISAATLDAESFAVFYDESQPYIYGYFLRRCGYRVETAEDLTQEAFLAAARQINRGQAMEAPLAWLYGVARHKLLDHFRAEGRITNGVVSWEDRVVDAVAATEFDTDKLADLDRERIEVCLELTPPAQKSAVILRYMDGLAVPEIADSVGKSTHAVESLLARGRANLKRLLSTEAEKSQ